MVGAIVLAAGAATRMGRQKMLLPFDGDTVLGRIIREIQSGGVTGVLAVTGADSTAVAHVAVDAGATVVHNPDFTRGMLSSVRTGLAGAPSSWSAALLALGDQPLIVRSTVRALLQAAATERDRIVVPTYEGKRGHPLLLPRTFWGEALTLHDDVGLRGVLHSHADAVVEVSMDSEDILADMDTPADYRVALERLAERDGDSTA